MPASGGSEAGQAAPALRAGPDGCIVRHMAYRYLADAVLLLHLAFILFVVAGALLVLRRRRWMPLHLAAAAWGVGIELSGGVCPLTRVELWLRRLAGWPAGPGMRAASSSITWWR